ncbi:hypothetical protein EJB05_39133, partial [Eragrostis curvula]
MSLSVSFSVFLLHAAESETDARERRRRSAGGEHQDATSQAPPLPQVISTCSAGTPHPPSASQSTAASASPLLRRPRGVERRFARTWIDSIFRCLGMLIVSMLHLRNSDLSLSWETDSEPNAELMETLHSDPYSRGSSSQPQFRDVSMSSENNNAVLDKHEIVNPRVGMTFETVDLAYQFFLEYGYRAGFGVSKRTSHSVDGVKYHNVCEDKVDDLYKHGHQYFADIVEMGATDPDAMEYVLSVMKEAKEKVRKFEESRKEKRPGESPVSTSKKGAKSKPSGEDGNGTSVSTPMPAAVATVTMASPAQMAAAPTMMAMAPTSAAVHPGMFLVPMHPHSMVFPPFAPAVPPAVAPAAPPAAPATNVVNAPSNSSKKRKKRKGNK